MRQRVKLYIYIKLSVNWWNIAKSCVSQEAKQELLKKLGHRGAGQVRKRWLRRNQLNRDPQKAAEVDTPIVSAMSDSLFDDWMMKCRNAVIEIHTYGKRYVNLGAPCNMYRYTHIGCCWGEFIEELCGVNNQSTSQTNDVFKRTSNASSRLVVWIHLACRETGTTGSVKESRSCRRVSPKAITILGWSGPGVKGNSTPVFRHYRWTQNK